MSILFALGVLVWLATLLLAPVWPWPRSLRAGIGGGAAAIAVACGWALWQGTALLGLPGISSFGLDGAAQWLVLFGSLPAAFAGVPSSPGASPRVWSLGASSALLGALGVFGLDSGVGFLIAWEVMSLGGGLMLHADHLQDPGEDGRSVLRMLAMLEVGAVALIAAWLLLAAHAGGSMSLPGFTAMAASMGTGLAFLIGVLALIGFGAKLGLLPFYEWFGGAYASGSGASGALLSGLVLNAAWYALARLLLRWLPASLDLGLLTLGLAGLSAILAALYALQARDWRVLLGFSTAENASIATLVLAAAVLFHSAGLQSLAGMAWLVGLVFLAGHSLAKGTMLLGADAVHHAQGSYRLHPDGLLRTSAWPFGLGMVFAGMSLAGMPPQAGFVGEWFAFQTLFQGKHMPGLAGRLGLALGGAALALTVALALATFVKVLGLGLQGRAHNSHTTPVPRVYAWLCGTLGSLVLLLAVGMPWWLPRLGLVTRQWFNVDAANKLVHGLLLVPLSAGFAFISPSMLVVIGPLLALLPLLLLLLARRRYGVRRVAVWYGGEPASPRAATTALTFAHAMRVLYSFVYRPRTDMRHEHIESEYFVHRIRFDQQMAPIFETWLFGPIVRKVRRLSEWLAGLQSGDMNVYLALIGLLLLILLGLAAF